MTSHTLFIRAAEAYAAHPCGHEWERMVLAAAEWAKEYRLSLPLVPAQPTQPAITHGEGSPLLRDAQDDFGRRTNCNGEQP